MLRLTKGLHPSKKILGYFYIKTNEGFYAYCGSIKLHSYKTEKECIKSFENRQ